jgi:hypothetical protein
MRTSGTAYAGALPFTTWTMKDETDGAVLKSIQAAGYRE